MGVINNNNLPIPSYSKIQNEKPGYGKNISKPSTSNNPPPDDVEDITIQIFAHLLTLSDGIKRDEIEKAILLPGKEISSFSLKRLQSLQSQYLKKQSLNFPPYQTGTNFYEKEGDSSEGSTPLVGAKNIYAIVTDLFLGRRIYSLQEDRRSALELSASLKLDMNTWNAKIREYYKDPFQDEMKNIFNKAKERINIKKNFEKTIYCNRITFFSTLGLSIFAKITSFKKIFVVGFVAFSVNLIFMVIYYGKSSFKLSEQGASLKASVNKSYEKALLARL